MNEVDDERWASKAVVRRGGAKVLCAPEVGMKPERARVTGVRRRRGVKSESES